METYWAGSEEEKKRIIDQIASPAVPTPRYALINHPQLKIGDSVYIETSTANPEVLIIGGQILFAINTDVWMIPDDPLTAETSYIPPLKNYSYLITECRNLKSENDYFRKQLSAINTPQKLQRYSVLYGFLSFFFWGVSKIFNVNLVHPILIYFIFGISGFFYLLGILMERDGPKYSGKQ